MKCQWLLLAGVVVLTNGVILAGAAYNRWSPPVQHLTLTERELSLPYWVGRDSESSEWSLAINWRVAQADVVEWGYNRQLAVSPAIFRGLRLQPVNCPGEPRRSANRIQGWVALEYNGPAYQQHVAQLQQHVAQRQADAEARGEAVSERFQQQLARAQVSDSRLYVVAVDRDLEGLKAQLQGSAQAHWWLPAELSAAGQCVEDQVHIVRLLINGLYLAHDQRQPVLGLTQRAGYMERPAAPRYTVEVGVGRRHQPWVISVAALAEAVQQPD